MPGGALCSPIARGEMMGVLTLLSLLSIYLFRNLRLSKADEAWAVVVEGAVRHAPLPAEAAAVTRVWSGILLFSTLALLLSGAQISVPMQLILCCIILSGFFIDKPLFQSIFHVSSMCSWFAVFDLLIFAKGDQRVLHLLLSPKGLFVGFLASVAIIRLQLGNKWQFRDPSHLLIGLVLLLGYFWGVDLPSCTLYNVDVMCSFFGNTSNQYLHNNSSARAVEVIKMLFAHILFNTAFYMNANVVSAESDSSDAKGGEATAHPASASDKENSKGPKSDKISGEEVDSSRRFSGATDTEQDDNMTGMVDENGQPRKYPEDCVEISEAEAIEIIQNGLNSFKTKRAT
jgi:hypothetical protein